jgi:hypothetical protein
MSLLSRNSIWLEVGMFALCLGYLLYLLRPVLFLGTATLPHDNLYWTLPVFTYFAEGIGDGALPLWNPYSHGGEPLAHIYLTTRLLDPASIAVAWLGQQFTSDLVLLANWDRVTKMILVALGSYLLLRQWAGSVLVRVALIPALVLSNFTANAFWQPGILDHFLYVPFLLIFLLNLLWKREYRWYNWIGAATFFGASLQSYFFVAPSLMITLLSLGFTLFRRDDLRAFLTTRSNAPKAFLGLLIVAAMAAPQAYLYRDLDRFELPPREGMAASDIAEHASKPAKVGMSYETIHKTGSFSQLQDFIGLLVPGLFFLRRTSEAGQYLGALVFLGALYGMVFAKHPLKRVWLVTGLGLGLLMFGPFGGLHGLLYHVFPPMWFLRHTEQLVPFFQLAILFFFTIGADTWLRHWHRESISTPTAPPGPLTRWLKAPENARALAIVITLWAILAAVPYLIRWNEERPSLFGSASLALLGLGALVYGLRRDLGARTLAATLVLAMFILISLSTHRTLAILTHPAKETIKTLDVFFHGWLYAGVFVLAPLALTYCWSRARNAPTVDGSAVTGVRLVGLFVLLFIATGFFYLPLASGVSNAQSIMHVTLSLMATMAALGVLHSRWLISVAPALRARPGLVRSAAGLAAVALMIPVIYPEGDGYFKTYAILYFNPVQFEPTHTYWTTSFFYFHWLSLMSGCVLLASTPRLLPDVLQHTGGVADAMRVMQRAVLVCGALPISLVANKLLRYGTDTLQHHDIIGIVFFVVVAALAWNQPRPGHPGATWRIARVPARWLPLTLLLWLTTDLAVSMAALAPDVYGIVSYQRWYAIRPDRIYAPHPRAEQPAYPGHRVISTPVAPYIGKYVVYAGQEMRYADMFARVRAMLDLPSKTGELTEHKISTAGLDEQINWARRSGFIQFRSYGTLLRSGIHPDILAEIFALSRPPFQFRPCAGDSTDFLNEIRSLAPSDAVDLLGKTVLLDGAPRHGVCDRTTAAMAAASFTHEILDYDYDSVRLKIVAPAAGYLYYADGYDPYWKARVDGTDTPVFRANFNFKAIPVEKGEHTVEFTYAPIVLRNLLGLYFAVFLAGILLVAVALSHGERRPT